VNRFDPNNIHYKNMYFFIVEYAWATFLSVYTLQGLRALCSELNERI
jgi:hypothetical protein